MVAAVAPRCLGLRVGTRQPCRITKHLNADGYCKLHAPGALQCRGTAKSTGERCRIRWDLNDDQLCRNHANQASHVKFPKDPRGSATDKPLPVKPREGGEGDKDEGDEITTKDVEPTATAIVAQCRGTAKSTGQQCRISKHLNADGYCKHHVPGALQCRGTAKSTGERCRIRWDLNDDQFCGNHAAQKPLLAAREDVAKALRPRAASTDGVGSTPRATPAVQCRGTAKSTGQRCKISWDLNAQHLCKYHQAQTQKSASRASEAACQPVGRTDTTPSVTRSARSMSATQCRGIAVSTGQRCRIRWDLDTRGFCEFHTSQHHHARL